MVNRISLSGTGLLCATAIRRVLMDEKRPEITYLLLLNSEAVEGLGTRYEMAYQLITFYQIG